MTTLVLSFMIPSCIALSVNLAGSEHLRMQQWGWLVGLLVQFLSATYAILSHDWGWLLGLAIVAPFFARNLVRGRRRAKQSAAAPPGRHTRPEPPSRLPLAAERPPVTPTQIEGATS
jgi:hypothetical protein